MEMQNQNDHRNMCDYYDENYQKNRRLAKVFAGIVVITAGALLLLKRTGTEIPGWVLSWPMLFIMIGIGSAIKHGFKRIHSYVFILLGGIFLAERMIGGLEIKAYVWPVVIMIIGLFIIFKPSWKRHHWRHRYYDEKKKTGDREDMIELNSVFGGVEKKIVSKNFKGGQVNAVFGGAEVDLMQADIEGRVVIEINQVFGATQLIVPSHWEVKSELSAVFGGIEDKRSNLTNTGLTENKILVLKGSCVFGGIEIRNG
jgi:predicted membrane protein